MYLFLFLLNLLPVNLKHNSASCGKANSHDTIFQKSRQPTRIPQRAFFGAKLSPSITIRAGKPSSSICFISLFLMFSS